MVMGCTCVLQQKFRSLLCPLISGKELFLLFNKGWLWKWYERQWSISADGIWAEIWWGNLERYLMYHKFVLWLPVFVWTSVPLDFYFDMCIHKYVGVMLFFYMIFVYCNIFLDYAGFSCLWYLGHYKMMPSNYRWYFSKESFIQY